jgi:uncharacterized protein
MGDSKSSTDSIVYDVSGMHCASCEVLIEKKLLSDLTNVKTVNASAVKEQVEIEYTGTKPQPEELSALLQKNGYVVSAVNNKSKSSTPFVKINSNGQLQFNKAKLNEATKIAVIAFIVIAAFIYINKSGLAASLVVNGTSALPAFFIFGLLASVSSCAALVGGIILSMSKQWTPPAGAEHNTWSKLSPHILFNAGRLISYALFGALLGLVGSFFAASITAAAYTTIAISILMLLLGLQMLGLSSLSRFQITPPKSLTRYIANQDKVQSRYMPFVIGALTFFLPCGFTLTMQGLAITTGSPTQSALLMLAFALGTLPVLLAIGLTSSKFMEKPHTAKLFLKTAGVIVVFFALFNFNSQLNVLGVSSLNDIKFFKPTVTDPIDDGFAPIVEGKQLIKMDALSYGYKPDYFKIKPNVPVRWEITDQGTSGCTNAVISKGLFTGQIDLTPNDITIKEFTPTKTGRYKFSCWMGMVSGVIDVIDQDSKVLSQAQVKSDTIKEVSSGATGCGGSEGTGCKGDCGGGCGNSDCPYAKK